MKVYSITANHIIFDDSSTITFYHNSAWAEHNYALFSKVDTSKLLDFEFDAAKLEFKSIDNSGFEFGHDGTYFYVPCYSTNVECEDDNDNTLNVYYNKKLVLKNAPICRSIAATTIYRYHDEDILLEETYYDNEEETFDEVIDKTTSLEAYYWQNMFKHENPYSTIENDIFY